MEGACVDTELGQEEEGKVWGYLFICHKARPLSKGHTQGPAGSSPWHWQFNAGMLAGRDSVEILPVRLDKSFCVFAFELESFCSVFGGERNLLFEMFLEGGDGAR